MGRRLFFRFCWRGFRICVRSGYFFIALIGYVFLHLGWIGLPEFLKKPLLEQVRRQGLELDYSRIRFVPLRGIVADRVNVHLRGDPDRRPLFVEELGLRLDWRPVLSLAPPRLASVSFTGGSAARAVGGAPGEPSAILRLEHLAGALEFISDDDWRLTWLTADLNGLTMEAMGSVSKVRRFLRRQRPTTELTDFQSPPLARALNEMDAMVFTDPPSVELQFAVNGDELQKSVLQFRCTTAGAKGPHGQFANVRLSVDVQPARNAPGRSHGVVRFRSAAAQTRWGALDSLRFHSDVEFVPTNALPESARWTLAAYSLHHDGGQLGRLQLTGVTLATNRPPEPAVTPATLSPVRAVARREATEGEGFSTELELRALDFQSRWITISNLAVDTHLWNSNNNWIPKAVDWRLTADNAVAEAARTLKLEVSGSALPVAPADQPLLRGQWTNASPWRVHVLVAASDLRVAPRHSADRVHLLLDWQHGTLRLTNLDAHLPAGSVAGSAWMDARSGDAGMDLTGMVEPLRLEPSLPPPAWQQLTNSGIRPGSTLQFDLHALGRVPSESTNQSAVLRELLSHLSAHGVLETTNCVIAELPLSGTRVPFELKPGSLRIPGLSITIPSGDLHGDLEAEFNSGQWHARIVSSLNPLELASLVPSPALTSQLILVQLAQSPILSGDLWGNWNDPLQTGVSLRVALTNATYRNEPITELRTAVAYTNRQLVFTGVELMQGTNEARVPVLHYDIPAKLLHITNAFTTLDPASVVRAIGPKTAKVLAPYQFPEAPTVRINGSIPVMDDVEGSVVFQASVPRLQWWYFEFEKLLATVQWAGNHISITNVAGGFYGGLVSANVEVNAADRDDAVFQFNASYTDVDLQRLVTDLSPDTNRLEGTLSGEVTVLEGHGNETAPWKGFGNAQLRNGYLWNLPLFGLLSPAFDTISPGLGAARFRDGNALFNITNRSVNFNRVELLSPAMRLQMRGPVDFDGRLRLVLEAEPLRDLPLFGPLVNFVLSPFTKLLEYDITGTLGKPEAELRHVPSFLLIPLQPFSTLKSVFKGSPAPPKEPPPAAPQAPPKP